MCCFPFIRQTTSPQAGPNEQIKLVGNNKKLGKWDMDDAPHLKFNPETGLWSFATRIPVATTLEYKFVLITATGAKQCAILSSAARHFYTLCHWRKMFS